MEGDAIYLSTAPDASPDGDRPFLDRFDLEDAEVGAPLSERCKTAFEWFLVFTGANGHDLLPDLAAVADATPPNAFVRTLGSRIGVERPRNR